MLSCAPSPEPIDFGSDMCTYCKMTIVDSQHAAEVVTSKGKVYKFDAIECMLPHILEHPNEDFSFILVNDYNKPSSLIDAHSSFYLITEAIPSPMGAYLSAFENESEVNEMLSEKGGTIYNWNDIKLKFGERYSNL